jgi:hypothetical protein
MPKEKKFVTACLRGKNKPVMGPLLSKDSKKTVKSTTMENFRSNNRKTIQMFSGPEGHDKLKSMDYVSLFGRTQTE